MIIEQWWFWSTDGQEWIPQPHQKERIVASIYEDGSCIVWGTPLDRDEKRDDMQDAQQRNGKP